MTSSTHLCPDCDRELPRTHFHKNKTAKSGLSYYCKDCSRRRYKEWYDAHSSKKIASLDWYYSNREYRKVYKKRERLKKYGLTPEEYNLLKEAQGFCCAACGRPESDNKRQLAVDHCHNTGLVRALLCTQCNTAIGLLGEDPQRIELLLVYLKSFETEESINAAH